MSFGIQTAHRAECSGGVGREGKLLGERNKFNNRKSFDYSLKKAQISVIYDHVRDGGRRRRGVRNEGGKDLGNHDII